MTDSDTGPDGPEPDNPATSAESAESGEPRAAEGAAVPPGPRGPSGQPRAEEFDRLVQELLPKIRLLLPHLSEIEALRAAALMAEYRLAEEKTLMWGGP